MANEHRRTDRVAEGIREVAATFLMEEAKDPRLVGLVTVTGVDVTRDLRSARIFVSVMGDDAARTATFEGLRSVASHLRSRVGRELRLRHAPELVFEADESVARAARIEELLARVRDERPADERSPEDRPADESSADAPAPDERPAGGPGSAA